jgi:hypothetical protein
MLTRIRSIHVAALFICLLALPAVLAAPGTFNVLSYAAVATVLIALAAIVRNAYTHAHETRSLAQLVSASDPGVTERHGLRHQS